LSFAGEYYLANGTTALAMALRGTVGTGGRIAIPAAVCPNVPAAVLASGNEFVLVDIDSANGGMSPAALAACSRRQDIAGAIAVHAYGNPCDMRGLAAVCHDAGLWLIEDCAQAEGAECGGRPVGGFGDVAVFSYGAGKILDIGGGGMTRTADAGLAERIAAAAAVLPESPDATAADDLAAIYKFLYNRFFPARLTDYADLLPRALARLGSAMLGRCGGAGPEAVHDARATLPLRVARRRAKAAHYRQALAGNAHLSVPPAVDGAVPWRFNVRLQAGLRDRVLKRMLADGRKASSWYPSLDYFLGAGDADELPQARADSLTLLNFWLDDDTNEVEIAETCAEVSRLVAEEAAGTRFSRH
jgi:dTDP-4-amino-4,6-dideoxygalactose transaminase